MDLADIWIICHHCFVKLDFRNAFNSVCRDTVRDGVATYIPDLLSYFNSAYGATYRLSFGGYTIDSAEGVQQGNPLGPIFFSLAVHHLLSAIQSEFWLPK